MNIYQKKLENNFIKMFWMRAFRSIKLIHIFLSLFYISRGITVSEIFYLSIIFTGVLFIFEIPSSYMADRWGRKPTIILSAILGMFSWVAYLFSYSFVGFIIGMIFYALSFALLSGTDEALIYDTNKELGNTKKSLKRLGKYQSAQSFFKIFTPFITVLFVKELNEFAYNTILILDIILSLVAVAIACSLKEPNHYMDLEKQEAGIIKDAFKILYNNKVLLKAMINKGILFISIHLLFDYYHVFYNDLGVTIFMLGLGWSIHHLLLFLLYHSTDFFSQYTPISKSLNILNSIMGVILFTIIIFYYIYPYPYLLFGIFIVFYTIYQFRTPFYSEFFNSISHSYNRATTLSLTNVLRIFIDPLIILMSAYLVKIDRIYPYIFTCILIICVMIFLRIPCVNKKFV